MKVIATNKKAEHDYYILERYEAGIVLEGSEVKSARNGNISIKEGYAIIENGEIYLINVHISPYEKTSSFQPDPKRKRKLLLHKHEIKRLIGKVQRRGFTLIPLKVYINERGYIKVELGLGKGKKLIDKREEIRRKEAERERQRFRW